MQVFTKQDSPIRLSGRKGIPFDPEFPEPGPGSIVLAHGLHGTAWQRFNSDGRWHPTRGGGSKTWDEVIRQNNVHLLYVAPACREAS